MLPVSMLPGAMPNASPSATRTAGAIWATTVLAGLSRSRQTALHFGARRQRARRANRRTLTAVDAFDVAQVLAERGHDAAPAAPR